MTDLEESLRQRFPAPEHRVSRRSYPRGTVFPGGMMAGTCYVLEGACEYRFGEDRFLIETGQHCDLPAGGYEFRVVGESKVDLVLVWKIPPSAGLTAPTQSAQCPS
jgi:hypothetical protein